MTSGGLVYGRGEREKGGGEEEVRVWKWWITFDCPYPLVALLAFAPCLLNGD